MKRSLSIQPSSTRKLREEIRLLEQEVDAALHQSKIQLQIAGQDVAEKIGLVAGAPCDFLQVYPRERRRPAGVWERVIAADDAVATLVEGPGVDRVIGDVRLRALDDVAACDREDFLATDIRIVEESQVWRRLLQLGIDAQDHPRDPVVGGPDIRVHKRIGQRAIEVAPEELDLAIQRIVIHAVAETEQQFVELTDVDRHARDRRDMVIGDHQRVDRLVEITRWRQLEILAALRQHDAVVRQYVAWPVRRMSLVEIADDAFLERFRGRCIEPRIRQQVLRFDSEEMRFLRRAQCRVGADLFELRDDV